MPITIAVTGAGSLFGQGIIRSLKMSPLNIRIIALDFFSNAVGLYWGDKPYLLPDMFGKPENEKKYLDQLMAALKKERAELLFVGTDFEIKFIARHRQILESETGCQIVVSSPRVSDVADDKWETHRFLKEKGFATPPSTISLEGLDDFIQEVGFPLIVKPRRGFRSVGVMQVNNREELDFAVKKSSSEWIIQKAVGSSAQEYTCGAVVLQGRCLGVIVMRRDLRDGNTYRAYLEPLPARLESSIREMALALNPHGSVNFQGRLDGEDLVVFEINARFSGTTIIRALAGFNEVEAVVRTLVLKEKVFLQAKKYGVVLRYWEELFVPWEDYNSMGALLKT
ncbi:MAG: ATP-grasp domain-containing protein [Deltaproteobacteria bacterium]|nr:ATP-grasp domain-containing protein [Deltaproteobacteria bacterium]